jgi:hypothetical protein
VLELDGFSIHPLGADDFPHVSSLQRSIPPDVFQLPRTEQAYRAFMADLARKPWSLPFVCARAGEPLGICFMSVAQVKNLNAYLVALFSEPAASTLPLALYIRHAFWTFPLHRLYAQLPALNTVVPQMENLIQVGFKREGMLVAHVAGADGPEDAIVVGLLRNEFDLWCEQNEPRLALG